jgi:uncharacterized lipoprotein YajG
MKKVLMLAVACAMFAACQNGKTTQVAEATDTLKGDSAVYEGLVPSADGAGISYRLALASDSTKGFSLEEAYMKSDTEVDTLYHYEGKASDMNSKGKHYLMLTNAKDDATFHFLIVNDSTLRMVSNDLEEPVAGELNYDLKLK